MIRSLVLILVDIPSVANACADMLPRASMNIDSLYCAPLVLQIKARERGQLAVCVADGWSTRLSTSHHIMFPLEVSQSLALNLGLTDEQFSIWTEMEMVAFSVLLNCRKYVATVHPPRSSTNAGLGASERCLWPEMNTKRLRSLSVRSRAATTHGASSVNSPSR